MTDPFDLPECLQRHARNEYVDGSTADWLDTAAARIREQDARVAELEAANPSDRLRGLASCLDSVSEQARADIARFGEWRCDYGSWMQSYREQIESILEATKGDK